MDPLTQDEIKEIAFAFGNGVDDVPWCESESHGEPDDPAPSWNVYVSDGQLMLIVPGSEGNPDFAPDLADSSTKVCRAIRQLASERAKLFEACQVALDDMRRLAGPVRSQDEVDACRNLGAVVRQMGTGE
ncbi:hypothetical protein LCGC14_2428530 [marine sediment metagenome]|uniref:Uncharacterized protein n=1 Tax=marine sediment metagenome TaxID=412755 RepID=A0A0F9BMR0_9ZZZZ